MSRYLESYERTMKTAGIGRALLRAVDEVQRIAGSPVNVGLGVTREIAAPYFKRNPQQLQRIAARPMRFMQETLENVPEARIGLEMTPEGQQLLNALEAGDFSGFVQSNPMGLAKDVGRLGVLLGTVKTKRHLDEKYEDEGGLTEHLKNQLRELFRG